MRILLFSDMLCNRPMATIDEIHRANLALLVEEFDGITALAEKLERSPSQVSQWLNGSVDSKTGKPRGVSSASCRYIEGRCKKLTGWMDAPHGEIPEAQKQIDRGTDAKKRKKPLDRGELRLLRIYRALPAVGTNSQDWLLKHAKQMKAAAVSAQKEAPSKAPVEIKQHHSKQAKM